MSNIGRYICIGKEVVFEESAKNLFSIEKKSILLLGNEVQPNLIKDVKSALEKEQCRVATVIVSLEDVKNTDALAEKMRQAHNELGNCHGIINLQECRESKSYQDMSYEETEVRIKYAFQASFLAVKEFYDDLGSPDAFCAFAGNLGGIFGITEKDIKNIWFSIQVGFLKSIQRDFPTLHCRTIDFDSLKDTKYVAEKLVEEIKGIDPYIELAYKQGKRYTLISVPNEIKEEEDTKKITIDENDVILFSGGGRGILYEMAKKMHEHFGAKIILTGRTKMPSGEEDFMQMTDAEFEAYKTDFLRFRRKENPKATVKELIGEYKNLMNQRTLYGNMKNLTSDKIVYYTCDTSGEDIRKLCEEVKEKYGSITGVVNGAGVPSLTKVNKKSLEECYPVLMIKCLSFYNLFMNLKDEPLKFFNNVGSISGRFGMDGQADYCAASDCLAKMTTIMRKEVPFRLFTSDWSAWEEIGMAVEQSVVKTHESRGVEYIPVKEGTEIFIKELLYGEDVNEILYFGNIGNDYLARAILQYMDTDAHKLRVQWDTYGDPLDHTKYPYINKIDVTEHHMLVSLKKAEEQSPLTAVECCVELYKLWKWKQTGSEGVYPFHISHFQIAKQAKWSGPFKKLAIKTVENGLYRIYEDINDEKDVLCEIVEVQNGELGEGNLNSYKMYTCNLHGYGSEYLFEGYPYTSEVLPTRFMGKFYELVEEYCYTEIGENIILKELLDINIYNAIYGSAEYEVRIELVKESNRILYEIWSSSGNKIMSGTIVIDYAQNA